MSNDRNTSDRARIEVRPGVFLWLSGPDLVAFRARQASSPDAPEAITSATVAAPENAALVMPKPRPSPKPAPVKRATRKKV